MAPEKPPVWGFDANRGILCGGVALAVLRRWAEFIDCPVPDDFINRSWSNGGRNTDNIGAYSKLSRMKEAHPDRWAAFLAKERILHGR